MARVFMKGCEAVAEAAVRAGCRFFAGYPITPQNEIPEYFARRLPEVGGHFVQGESEVASVNMLYGSAATGTRSMSSSSSTGISLYSEGVSFMASSRTPAVYINVSRGGPGIGAIQPAQQDFLQATKASGNGGFEMLVLAPSTVQEAVDMTYEAFDLAERDKNPVLVLMDGVIGTMMEPVVLPEMKSDEEVAALKAALSDISLVGHKPGENAHVMGGSVGTGQEVVNIAAAELYKTWDKDVEVEEEFLEDAELVLTGYGMSGRIARTVVRQLRAEGYKVGLIRPIKVHPFPYESYAKLDEKKVKAILDCEMSIPAQVVWDINYAVQDRIPIETTLRSGGQIISAEQIKAAALELLK